MLQSNRHLIRLWGKLCLVPEIVEQGDSEVFTPCHPQPSTRDPNLLQIIIGARRNLIAVWPATSYRAGIDSFRVLRRQIVFVNSPEHIRHVVVTRHSNFERKSPQMRRTPPKRAVLR